MSKLNTILDHGTDIVGIVAIAAIILLAGIEPNQWTLSAIVSIALGKKVIDMRNPKN